MKLTSHPYTIRKKLIELGTNHDKEALAWKKDAETKLLECDVINKLVTHVTNSDPLIPLNELVNNENIQILNHYNTQDVSNCFENISSYAKKLENKNTLQILDAYKTSLRKSTIYYQIIGDNLDLNVQTRHKTNDHKNNSFHWFNMYAIIDPVSGNHLSDKHQRYLDEVPLTEFLPTSRDVQHIEKDFIVLCARILVKHLPQLKELKKVLVYHIPHQYTQEMSKKSEEVSNR